MPKKTKPKMLPPSSSGSPIQAASRDLKEATKILLAVRAGGRCEFPGCNEYLFEHPLTLKEGNFSERAHIVAFSPEGPRGAEGERPVDINDVANLMLLCQPCHTLIDTRWTEYPRETLRAYKEAHETRILHMTSLGPELATSVVQLKAKIAGDAVDIPIGHVTEAVAPRYPVDRKGHIIDLTGIDDDSDEFVNVAQRQIAREVRALYSPGMDVDKTRHISLFALAPIHLLIFLGSRLSNKIPVDLFQRHRDGSNPWVWRTSEEVAAYEWKPLQQGADNGKVALIISLSGQVHREQLPPTIDASYSIYELTLKDQPLTTDLLRQRQDLEEFRQLYRRLLAELMKRHVGLEEISLFPAIPAPIAVACGYDLLPKVHPALCVYDFDKGSGGFNLRTRINANDKQYE
ncbi:MAG: SAVED domain-containing protein [bacterium]